MTVEWLGDWKLAPEPVVSIPKANGPSASRPVRLNGTDGRVSVLAHGLVTVAGKPYLFPRADTSLAEMNAGLPRITAWVEAECPKWRDEVES